MNDTTAVRATASFANAPILLRADGVSKNYHLGRVSVRVLDDCDLLVRQGEFVAVMGKSGSGKSTLLHVLGALDVPDRGEVRFGEEWISRPQDALGGLYARLLRMIRRGPAWSAFLHALVFSLAACVVGGLYRFCRLVVESSGFVWSASGAVFGILLGACAGVAAMALFQPWLQQRLERTRVLFRRETVGFVFQFYHLLPELTVLENVLLPRMVASGTGAWNKARGVAQSDARRLLERVGLADRLEHRPSELSGGERQRVAIARALVHHPRVLLADEPTGNLDAEAGANIMRILKSLRDEGQTIVMVTHDPGIAAYADRVLTLESGRLRAVGDEKVRL